MPTSGLCRPLAQNGLWRRRSLRWSRHNHSASKNARSLSFGRKQAANLAQHQPTEAETTISHQGKQMSIIEDATAELDAINFWRGG
jgi:hypothetical protein